jgi:enoyl-[acyl-carrier protein] reductase I
MSETPSRPLDGKRALVLGIANEHSIAYGCARAFRQLGAELAITYLNDKALPHVEPLARELEAPIFERMDVQQPGQLEAVFDCVRQSWGRLDIALHAIAFAPKEDLQAGLLNCSAAGFSVAIWVIPTDEEAVIASHTLAVVRSTRTLQASRMPAERPVAGTAARQATPT